MTDAPLDFTALRAKAIAAAQDASGNIWTDYNLHDPGVTLMEQTLFGLTEVAYMGDHTVRDLLTAPDAEFSPADLALFDPRIVLAGRPVTRADLASLLSDVPEIDRVFVHNGPKPGLVDLVAVPHRSADPDARDARTDAAWADMMIATLHEKFALNRLLGQDIDRITIAKAAPVDLLGQIEISAMAEPERVLAEVIHQVRLLLRGLPADHGKDMRGATRADVYDDVSRLGPGLPADISDSNRFEGILAAIRHIPGLVRATDFDMVDLATHAPMTDKTREKAIYHDPVLPRADRPMKLQLTRNDAAIAVNPDTLRDELGRIEAAWISRQGNRVYAADWDVLRPGRHRDAGRAPVDDTLPAPYRHLPTPARSKPGAETSLARYRGMIDSHLNRIAAPLAGLHQRYRVTGAINLADPADVRERGAVLDYLISLQGESMPPADAADLHVYRGVRDRLAWQVTWRESYLSALPAYHYYSGTAHPDFGFAPQLAHLTDMGVGGPADLDRGDDPRIGIVEDLPLPAAGMRRDDLIAPSRATDMFVTRSDDVEPLSSRKLALSCPWVVDGQITAPFLRRAAMPGAYLLARNKAGDWEVLFQPDDSGPLYPCGTHGNHARAEEWANRLRLSFARINQAAERLWLIEDIRLRSNRIDFVSGSAVVVVPGWTARTSRPAYRRHVTDMIARLAPAHLHVRPLWVSAAQMARLEPQIGAWQDDTPANGPALRDALRKITEAVTG